MSHHENPSSLPAVHIGLGVAIFGCLGLMVVFILGDILFFAEGASFKREGGGLETVSAVLYGVAAFVFFAVTPRDRWALLFHVPALMVFFACRELDFDKAFTPSGILSLRLYSGDAALSTKLISSCVAGLFVAVVLRTVWRGAPAAWQALRNGALWPWFAVLAGALVVVTKSIDGLGRKLRDFGIIITRDVDVTASLVEEIGEAFIPVCAILAIVACWRDARA